MIRFHFERGKRFECPVEIFQFVYSDWQAADKVTGKHWNVKKHENKFKGERGGFWGEFDLVHYEFDGKNGVFTYFVTLGGKNLNGNGKLIIKYGVVDQDIVYGEGNIDIELRGFISTLIGKMFHSKLQNLVDDLVNYQHKACTIIAKDPKAIMEFLSEEQREKLTTYLERSVKKDIFESNLGITLLDGKWLVSFETPIPTYQKIREKVEVKETHIELLDKFNRLIENGNNYYTLSRSTQPDREFEVAGRDFYEEAKILGNNLYTKYIVGEMKIWLKSMFNYKREQISE